MKKSCTKCGRHKPLNNFHKRAGGIFGLQSACKQCNIDRVRQWQRENPEHIAEYARTYTNKRKNYLHDWVASVKEKHGCSNCNEDCPDCLDLHHVNDDKVKSVPHWITCKSLTKLVEEINKCCVLCSNCHRKHHTGHPIIIGKTCNVSEQHYHDYLQDNTVKT